jgi:hypothetical protein
VWLSDRPKKRKSHPENQDSDIEAIEPDEQVRGKKRSKGEHYYHKPEVDDLADKVTDAADIEGDGHSRGARNRACCGLQIDVDIDTQRCS